MKILALLLSLSLLVITHEFGHLGFAKLFKTRVRRFYLFFNPKFSILKARKFDGRWHFLFFNSETPDSWYQPSTLPRYREEEDEKGKKSIVEQWELKEPDNTLWGIGWVPLGGYCDIAGMVDETKSTKDFASEPQPWEYRTKKAWQRLCIISGGVLVNFLSALLIYTCIFAHWGKDDLPLRAAELGYDYHEILLEEGFRNGDIIYAIDHVEQTDIAEAQRCLLLDKPHSVVVLREGVLDTFALSDDLQARLVAENPKTIMTVRMPFVVSEFMGGSAAKQAGMQVGDRVVALDGERCETYADISQALAERKGQEVTLGLLRDGEPCEVTLTLGNDGKLGVMLRSPEQVFDVVHTDYTFLQAIPVGIQFGWQTLTTYVSSMKLLFTPEGAKSLGGFGTLGSMFPSEWDWLRFWNITALLAVILAFMNVIPIPGLDGGHILFTLWEMVTRRKPSDKFLEVAQNVGMILLLALLILANGNDLLRFLK